MSSKNNNSNNGGEKTVEPDYEKDSVWGEHEKALNDLVNHNGVNDPTETLYIMTLISNHNIKQESELFRQLKQHRDDGCDESTCGQVMSDTFENRVDIMYGAQEIEFGYKKYSRQTCRAYLRDLFARKSLNGSTMETKAVNKLNQALGFDFRKSTDKVDNDYAVDIVVQSSQGQAFAGIQVKPKSYDTMDRQTAKEMNISKNENYDYPVYYLTYEDEEFQNINDVVNDIDNLAKDIMTGQRSLD